MQRATTDEHLYLEFDEAKERLKELRPKDLSILADYLQGKLHVSRMRHDIGYGDEFDPYTILGCTTVLKQLLGDVDEALRAKAD